MKESAESSENVLSEKGFAEIGIKLLEAHAELMNRLESK